jgi:hypothetical protein
MFFKNCGYCNKSFEVNQKNEKIFCSLLCSNKSRSKTPKQSIEQKTIRNANGCLDFTGPIKNGGYGRVAIGNGKYQPAHRISWKIHHGEIPEGMCVLHKCDRPICCEISHLFLGTQRENIADMMAKKRNRQLYGESANKTKLTENEVLQIKMKLNEKILVKEIAKEFNISIATIRDINKNSLINYIQTLISKNDSLLHLKK